ncbi:m-AAA protease-interacting protein 1, mitochondrial isoform X2 [Anabrus simplex]|uniref:m-AAA protease-interacting protein 1, mitochondrial isoform X2 n=1 Tax=Anabrus simplex TaxID=316456 RepID=UPI0034DDA931
MTAFITTCTNGNPFLRFVSPTIGRSFSLSLQMLVSFPAVPKLQYHYDTIASRAPIFGLGFHKMTDSFISDPRWNRQQVEPRKCGSLLHRRYHENDDQGKPSEKRPVPKLLYMQNPLTWLVNKLDFGMLRRTWDPQFDESEFRRGTKQAISTITHLVAMNMFDNLKGLLTKQALAVLQHEVETSWTDQQRRNIALEPEDIQLAVPRRVHFQRIKFCDVDMIFIALKWAEHSGSNAYIFIEIIARFHREYSEGRLPDWTLSLFQVTRFNVLAR